MDKVTPSECSECGKEIDNGCIIEVGNYFDVPAYVCDDCVVEFVEEHEEE